MAPARLRRHRTPPFRLHLLVAAMLSLCGLLLWAGLYCGLLRVPGVELTGVEVSVEGDVDRTLQRRAQLWGKQSLAVHVGYHVFRPVRSALGWNLHAADARKLLHHLGRSPNPLVSLHVYWVGLFGGGHSLAWRPRVHDPQALARYVERIRGQVERLPVVGSYAPDGSPIPGIPGEALDTTAAQGLIAQALLHDKLEIRVPTLVTPPPPGNRRFNHGDGGTDILMYTQETTYLGSTGRATNIELATQAVDGAVLLPGADFSFNRAVGKRDPARGFAAALELANGELVQGFGGGVCQVAGTLHAAAFFAGLLVEEYRAHSRLSRLAYLPPGLDAMVAWPNHVEDLANTKDMRLRNPYPFPVRIAAAVIPDGQRRKRLQIRLFGAAPPFRVEYSFKELARIPAEDVERPDPDLSPGETRIQQRGLDGLVIARHRTLYTPYGRLAETTRVAYPPTPRIIRVGRHF